MGIAEADTLEIVRCTRSEVCENVGGIAPKTTFEINDTDGDAGEPEEGEEGFGILAGQSSH
jgi:hypothetical protein